MQRFKLFSRIAADIVMIALVAWAPLWAILLLSIAFAWVFAPYYEIIAWGLAFDAVYGFRSVSAIICAAVIFVAILLFKRRTRI